MSSEILVRAVRTFNRSLELRYCRAGVVLESSVCLPELSYWLTGRMTHILLANTIFSYSPLINEIKCILCKA